MYQRYNPLPSCPPGVVDSQVDWQSREYFSNTAPNAWGPGARGKGLSVILPDGVAFDAFGLCLSGPREGFACGSHADCSGPQGVAVCQWIDLRCSYKGHLQRADETSALSDMSQGDRATLLSDSFVETPAKTLASASNATAAQLGKTEILKWDAMGLPPVCDETLFVLEESATMSDMRIDLPQINYTFDAVSYTNDHTPAGALVDAACMRKMPGVGERCRQPPVNCTRWPGCNYSAWDKCAEISDTKTRCLEELTIHRFLILNASLGISGWEHETILSPTHAQVQHCAAGMQQHGNLTCSHKVVLTYEMTEREYVAMPVYSAWVCERYKQECSKCFCIDSIANFWIVWFFNLSGQSQALFVTHDSRFFLSCRTGALRCRVQ